MKDFLTLLLFLAFLVFIFGYNGWLKEHYGVSALSLGRIMVGTVDAFILLQLGDAEGVLGVLGILAIGGLIFLLLLAVNYNQVGVLPQAIVMTLWHLAAGLMIIVIWYEATQNKKKKE